ncbi:MAG: ATP-dependent Lhr-like helicase [Candidatus Poriferisodalaceae bacterium]|jgi:ATP-dependent Lhr-like helicase
MERFSPVVREWFATSFREPTAAQNEGWDAIANGDHTLILAPTGSGKTLASFLWGIDRVMSEPVPDKLERTRVLYISPLRALAVDVEKNLRAPIQGITLASERMAAEGHDTDVHVPTVGLRSGDTPANERRRLVTKPPDILITTPESLYLMLTSKARETLRGVRWIIIDEIHSVAATKRGSHLAVSLERLEEITRESPQRIGLSATQRPLDEIARFLGGTEEGKARKVAVVDVGRTKQLDIEVIVPVDDMGDLGAGAGDTNADDAAIAPVNGSIWPAVHPRLLELILQHRSTLIFVNARRLAERLASRLNELHFQGVNRSAESDGRSVADGEELVMAHHGSLSREQRLIIEDQLKSGQLRALVATSSLELGIDMGAVDLVIQVESPGSVASGLQRIGRAGHQVGAPSRGKIFPKHRGDLLEAAVVVKRMQLGQIEETRYPRNALDVLAQQIVAMAAIEDWDVEDLLAVIKRAAPYEHLSQEVFESVLDLLAGRYPSDEFSELRPRVVWDRVAGTVRARQGAGRLAVTNAGTIPDRGLYGVFLPDGKRVGELDEEMVYESRVGEAFLLGASTWRIEEITHDRVVVSPAPGQPGKMPFWHGDRPGRPLELGRAIGAFVRETIDVIPADLETAMTDGSIEPLLTELMEERGLDRRAATNLVKYLDEQRYATGVVPDDRTIVVERFRDEIGDWRVCILTPFGAKVHAPWAVALQANLEEQYEMPVETMWSDDGIVLRLPESADRLPLEHITMAADEVEEHIVAHLPSTAMFASRFREVAGRALLLPRRRPGERTPLWMQRQRSANLLQVASKYPTFPMLLETSRECLQEVFDVPALREVLGDLATRKIRMVPVDTDHASPMAQSLLFGWIAQYMYEGDAPLAERRAAALSLDRDLLRDLLGAEELRELLDPGVLADLELELQRLTDNRRARDVDEVHDLLRVLGDLSMEEVDMRCTVDPAPLIAQLVEERRAIEIGIGGDTRFAAAEDAARYRDAIGCAVPVGLPVAFTDPVDDPLYDLVARYAATHGPFTPPQPARRFGVPIDRVRDALLRVEAAGRIQRGEFRPEGTEREWCEVEVLRALRRRSLASLRREVEPVEQDALARFLPTWHGIDRPRSGADALTAAITQLQGAAIPASTLENDVLPVRVAGYRPGDLDALLAAGDIVWMGAGSVGASDGRVRLFWREQAALLAPIPDEDRLEAPVHDALRGHLTDRGASFWPDLFSASGLADEAAVVTALWDLVWAGEVTNDTFGPVRAMLTTTGRGSRARKAQGRRGRPRPGQLTKLGPPSVAGRWSLVAPLLEPCPSATERSHLQALQLLERHGVLTREGALGENHPGGFQAVYGLLRALEERGQVRRGYFVAGLGGAQFATPGAVDRLRDHREAPDEPVAVVLASTDPAQPYGAALPWPASGGRPARSTGSQVVLVDGEPRAYLERGGKSLVLFEGALEHDDWVDALAGLARTGRVRALEINRIDGEPAVGTDAAAFLHERGFAPGYKGPVLRP